jgi:small subunit ribosomal protein S21
MASREHRPQKPKQEGLRGTRVDVRDNNMGQAMRRLKKLLQAEGVFQEMRQREAFEKPSMKRKKAKAAAKKRWKKEIAKRDEI